MKTQTQPSANCLIFFLFLLSFPGQFHIHKIMISIMQLRFLKKKIMTNQSIGLKKQETEYPNEYIVYYDIGRFHINNNDYKLAFKYLNKARSLSKDNEDLKKLINQIPNQKNNR